MLSEILVFHAQLVFHLIMSPTGYTDTSSLSQRLHPSCYIDTIAVDIAIVFNNVAEINTDAELHLAIISQLCVSFGKITLDFDSTVYRINNAAKLRKKVVSR